MRHVIEWLISRAEASGTTKIIQRQGCETYPGEAQSKLFVKLVQPAHVGIDKDLCCFWTCGMSSIGGKAVSICRCQNNVFSVGAATLSRWKGGSGIIIVAHVVASPLLRYKIY